MPVINEADAVAVGAVGADAVYAGTTLVWSSVPPWTPASLTGLAHWLDASQLALADGAPVDAWPDLADLSGFNRQFVPKGAGTPTYTASGLNGLGVVYFDGALQDTNRALHYYNHESTFRHVFMVARFRLATFNNWNGLVGGSGGNDLLWVGYAGQPYWYNHWSGDWIYHLDGVLTPPNLTGPVNNVWHQFNASRISAPWVFWMLQIGQDRGEPRYWDGDVAEVIFYDRVLSDAERIQVEGYLQTKWGL